MSESSPPAAENLFCSGNLCSSFTVHSPLHPRTQLSEANDKTLAVQECYISVCKEKDMLEERVHIKEEEEASIRDNEVQTVPESVHSIRLALSKALFKKRLPVVDSL